MKHRREKLSEDNVAFIIFCKYNKSTTSKSVKMLFVVTVSVLNREPFAQSAPETVDVVSYALCDLVSLDLLEQYPVLIKTS